MTAILAMCRDDGAFVATDAGFDRTEGDDGPGGRTFRIDDALAMSGMGHAPAVRRVAAELDSQLAEGHTREEAVALAEEIVGKVSKTVDRNHPDLDTTFQIVLIGHDHESGDGYVAVVESDTEAPTAEVQSELGQMHVAGSNVDLLMAIHEDVREGVVTKEATLPLDVWASALISVAAQQDDSITMPATLAQVDADGYHEATTESRITDPAREFTIQVR